MEQVLQALAASCPARAARFVRIEAEEVDELAERYDVVAVPHFVICKVRKMRCCETASAPASAIYPAWSKSACCHHSSPEHHAHIMRQTEHVHGNDLILAMLFYLITSGLSAHHKQGRCPATEYAKFGIHAVTSIETCCGKGRRSGSNRGGSRRAGSHRSRDHTCGRRRLGRDPSAFRHRRCRRIWCNPTPTAPTVCACTMLHRCIQHSLTAEQNGRRGACWQRNPAKQRAAIRKEFGIAFVLCHAVILLRPGMPSVMLNLNLSEVVNGCKLNNAFENKTDVYLI